MSADTIVTALVTLIGGAGSGFFAARYQARAQIESVRLEAQSRIDVLELERDHALEARAEEAEAAERLDARQVQEDLSLAATDLIAALRKPDAMNRNVTKAQRAVRKATSRAQPGSPLKPHADALHEASVRGDLQAVRKALKDMGSSVPR